ncbi:MAG: ethanolamine ammonia-lyase light chain EutC, partial [Bacteroidota bacterium]
CVVAADGLSAYALERNLGPLLFAFIPKLHEHNLSASPLCLVKGGRVAVGDEIGQRLTSNVAVVCIGERPGLSSTDSLGVYMTFDPKIGRTDESRNCISNIRSEGLKPHFAAEKLLYLIKKSLQMQCSGVQLKDESDPRLGNAQVW